MHISINTVDGVVIGDIISSVDEDEKVVIIIRDALEDTMGGERPDPEAIWADIASTLGITI